MKRTLFLLGSLLFWNCNSNSGNPSYYIEPGASGVYSGTISATLPGGSLTQAIIQDSVVYDYVTLGSFDSTCTISSFRGAVRFSSKASDTSAWFTDTAWSQIGGNPPFKTAIIQFTIYDSIERAHGYTYKDSIIAIDGGTDSAYVFPALEYRITKVCP